MYANQHKEKEKKSQKEEKTEKGAKRDRNNADKKFGSHCNEGTKKRNRNQKKASTR